MALTTTTSAPNQPSLLPATLPVSATRRLLELGTFLRRSKGRVLCRERQVQREVLLLISGDVLVASGGVPRALVGANTRIGHPPQIGRRLWGETASTLTATELLVFSMADLHRIGIETPDLYSALSA